MNARGFIGEKMIWWLWDNFFERNQLCLLNAQDNALNIVFKHINYYSILKLLDGQ